MGDAQAPENHFNRHNLAGLAKLRADSPAPAVDPERTACNQAGKKSESSFLARKWQIMCKAVLIFRAAKEEVDVEYGALWSLPPSVA